MDESSKCLVIMIGDRFFYECKNKRVQTAWHLAGAKLFSYGSSEIRVIEQILIKNGKEYEIKEVIIQEVA